MFTHRIYRKKNEKQKINYCKNTWKELQRQLELADVNHCLYFDQVSDEIIEYFNIQEGDFDSVGLYKYIVPSFQAIGKEYQRLIIDVSSEQDNIEGELMA